MKMLRTLVFVLAASLVMPSLSSAHEKHHGKKATKSSARKPASKSSHKATKHGKKTKKHKKS